MQGKIGCPPPKAYVDEVIETPAFSPLHKDTSESVSVFMSYQVYATYCSVGILGPKEEN